MSAAVGEGRRCAATEDIRRAPQTVNDPPLQPLYEQSDKLELEMLGNGFFGFAQNDKLGSLCVLVILRTVRPPVILRTVRPLPVILSVVRPRPVILSGAQRSRRIRPPKLVKFCCVVSPPGTIQIPIYRSVNLREAPWLPLGGKLSA